MKKFLTEINYKPMGRFFGLTVFILLCFAVHVFCCGAPQYVAGRVHTSNVFERVLLPAVVITLEGEVPEDPVRTARVNAFGYFFIDEVPPCSKYTVSAFALGKRAEGFPIGFKPAARQIYVTGDGPTVGVDFDLNILE